MPMKIWLKTLLAAAAGIGLGILLGQRDSAASQLLATVAEVALRVGRYAVFPSVFFGVLVGTAELRTSGAGARVVGRMLLYLLTATALLTVLGLVSVLVLSPDRIPIVPVEQPPPAVPGVLDLINATVPANLFQVLVSDGSLLLPLLVLAVILGLHLGFDTAVTAPVSELSDALARIFFRINSLVVELFWIAALVIAAATVVRLSAAELALYRELFIILVIDVVVLYMGVFPGLLYLLGERTNPFRWIYAALGPSLTGAVTGDHYVSLGSLLVHGRGSFGLPRALSAAVYPWFALFGRSGTALVTAVSYIMIIRSYFSLEVTAGQVLWVALFTFLTSFALGGVPGLGVIVSLSLLWSLGGQGLPEGYLIMQPIAPLLISVGVMLDVTTSALAGHLVGRGVRGVRPIPVRDFV